MLLAITFIVFICLATILFLSNKNNSKQKTSKGLKKLPGPINFPGIGAIFQIVFLGHRDHNYEAFHAACIKYGKTMGFRGGVQEYVITEDAAAIKEVLTSPDWTYRFPNDSIYKQHTFGKNIGILFGNGDSWRESRRFATRSLGENGFGSIKSAEDILSCEIEHFVTHIENLRNKDDRGRLFIHSLFAIPSLNVNWTFIAGNRIPYEDEKLQYLLKLILKGAECEFALHPVFQFPIIDKIPGLSPLTKFGKAFEEIYKHLDILLKNRRSKTESVSVDSTKEMPNLIDNFLQKIKDGKQESNVLFTDEDLMVSVADLLCAATDTTANSLSFAIQYMIKYPHVQCKIHEELNGVLGKRMVSLYDKPLLSYTEATMWEVFRMSNVLPILIRTASTDTQVGGYYVKKGTSAVLNMYQMHMDPNTWADPYSFRPERFIDSNGNLIKDIGVMPFGGGRRICVGQTVAKYTFFIFFATLLQMYNFEEDEKNPITTMEPVSGFTNSPRPFYAKLIKR